VENAGAIQGFAASPIAFITQTGRHSILN